MLLPQQWIDYLVQQPETGMGWQKCVIEDKNGVHVDVFVFGSQFIPIFGGIDLNSITKITVLKK